MADEVEWGSNPYANLGGIGTLGSVIVSFCWVRVKGERVIRTSESCEGDNCGDLLLYMID